MVESDRNSRSLLTILVIGMTGFVLHALRDVLLPLFLAFFISYLGSPILRLLARVRVPNRLALLAVLLIFGGALFGLGLLVTTWVQEIQAGDARYRLAVEELIRRAEHWISSFGVNGTSEDAPRFEFAREFAGLFSPAAVVQTFGGLASAAADMLLVLVFLVFILADRANRVMDRRMIQAFSTPGTEGARSVIEDIHRTVEAYITLKTIISIATGLLTFVTLQVTSVPYAALFGFLALLLNYIPTVGSIAGALLPTGFAFLHHAQDPVVVLGVGIALGTIQVVVGNFIEPWIMGKRLGLNPLTIMVGLVVWGFLWGIWGMVLSVPLMVTLRTILEKTDTLPSVRALMASD